MTKEVSRRSFLKAGAASAAAMATMSIPVSAAAARSAPNKDLEEMTIAEMQSGMESGRLSSRQLTAAYLARIRTLDEGSDGLRSIIQTNPDAMAIAGEMDRLRQRGEVLGPLHGIPIVLKDNIDTDDSMRTTAGSLALVDSTVGQDATVTAKLRAAGAVVLGKANLSEWANFRAFESSSGWSAVGDQVRNPYVLNRNPCGSSSGTGAAVSAALAAAGLGTETDGSIVCPSSATGLVGIKPSVGLTSRAGVVPISRTQDTVGPMGRTVADAAAVLGVLTGVDPRDPATADSDGKSFNDYTQFLDPNGLQGAKIGVARELFFPHLETSIMMEEAIAAIDAAGATLVDVSFPSFAEFSTSFAEFGVLLYEFKTDIALYLETRNGGPKTLADLIAFNNANAEVEMKWFAQEIFELSQTFGDLSDPEYLAFLADSRRISRDEGIDAVMAADSLDAIIAPTGTPAWPTDLPNGDCFRGGSSSYAAMAGYPLITVPMGDAFGLPVGITFMAGQWQEPQLIKLASGFEAATQARRTPSYLETLPETAPGGGRGRGIGLSRQEAMERMRSR